MVDLTVHGAPRGKGRPKFVKATGRAYTDAKTVAAEQAVRDAWQHAGAVTLPDGPLVLHLTIVLARPATHWKRDGSLSAAGLRSWWPTRKPDLDNAEKLVLDSLSGHAFRDDAQVVHAVTWKRWAGEGEAPHTRVRVAPIGVLP